MVSRTLFLAALLGLCGCSTRPLQPHQRLAQGGGPPPTEHRLDEDAEARNRLGRERWLEELHRAGPDVDWRALERENGRLAQARRNALSGASGTKAGGVAWRELGSSNQAGRMQVGALSTARQWLYAGSALGGLWKAAADGSGWTPLGDNLYGGAYDLAVLPGELAGDPDVLAVRIGGDQLRVSRDEGLTWETPTGLAGLNQVRGLAVLQTPTPTLLVCGHVPGIGNQVSLRASTDWGRTFVERWKSSSAGKGWMWVPRAGPGAASDVYVARRGDLLRSVDGGYSFQLVGTSDPSASDVRLVGSEAGAPTLYAMTEVAGAWTLHRSDDSGGSFQAVHAPTDFWGALCASTVDPLLVAYGGVEAHRSYDGGASFKKVNGWGQYYGSPATKLHADIMGLVCLPDPAGPPAETWYVCTDGGIYESADRLQTVANRSLAGLGVSQYYSTLTSSSDPGLVLAGSQDQGYQFGIQKSPTTWGPSTPFVQLISGDYGHLTSSDGSHGVVYSTYPGFLLVSSGQGANQLASADFPPTAHSWLPPVVADPLDAHGAFFCGDRLWRYAKVGGGWVPSQHSGFDFTAGGAAYLSTLAFAPTDPQRAYAATNNGRLYRSSDHGLTWQVSSSTAPGQHYFYGTAIAAHPLDPLEAAVGGAGYSTPGVVRTTDGGVTWLPEANGLPSTLVYDLVYAPDGSGDLYAATESGPWRWDRVSGLWTDLLGDEAPLTLYWSVETVGTDTVRFGTYGRGIWDYRIPPAVGWLAYGFGKTNSLGLQAWVLGSGTPALSSNDFAIQLIGGASGNPGLFMYASGSATIPFAGATLLLQPPVLRGPTFQIDSLTQAQASIPVDPTLVGTTRCYQAWYRDPAHPDGTGIGLSNGLWVTFGP